MAGGGVLRGCGSIGAGEILKQKYSNMKNEIKISVKLEVSETVANFLLSLSDDLGMTENEWAAMSEPERMDAIQAAVDDLPIRPYWVVYSFEESN